MYQLVLQDNLSEIIHYEDPIFPIRAYQGELREYIGGQIPAHWHSEVELLYILEGSAVYHVNADRFLLHQGEGLLINSNRVHYGNSPDHTNFRYAVLQFRPEFVDNPLLRRKYVDQLIYNSSLDAILISKDAETILSCLKNLISLNLQKPLDHALEITAEFYALLSHLLRLNHKSAPAFAVSKIPALQNMLCYIQEHYTEPIRLSDIAAAGTMCRSKCCDLFRDVLQQGPMEFTKNFRIQQSIRLLQNTELTISEIAERCGFNSVSYYVECFHRAIGQSPKKYRTQLTFKNMDRIL